MSITAWSPSRIFTFEKCPALAKFKFIDKLEEPSGEASARGDEIHKKAEDYLGHRTKAFPAELAKLKKDYTELRKRRPIVEMQLAFDKSWKKVEWFSRFAWLRIKMDAVEPPVVDEDAPAVVTWDHKTGSVDKKTGKLKQDKMPEYEDQLEIYGLGGLKLYPVAAESQGKLAFVDVGQIVEGATYKRKDEAKLQKKWEKRVTPMFVEKRFDPKPGDHCRYCHFRRGNGGPCKY